MNDASLTDLETLGIGLQVRLYNPLGQRELRVMNLLTDLTRVNRRMHNKSFTAASHVSIVGGRNIGNEYFGAGSDIGFADLDVIAAGRAVHDVRLSISIGTAPRRIRLRP